MIAPTRELAVQIHSDAEGIGKYTGLKLAIVFGGVDYEKQRRILEQGVDVLIGTPGRIIDYFKQHVFDLRHIQVAVLDEADRMFDLGFIKDIRFILRRLPHPTHRLNMMFSATLSYRVLELAYEHMNNPELIRIEPDKMTVDRVRQVLYFPSTEEKIPLLMGLLRRIDARRTMVFVNTRRIAEVLERTLTANGFVAQALSGDVPQNKRLKMMRDFHNGDVAVLIATDVASRGLHIPDVSHVFNFDLPNDAEDYVHRIGRTARAGAEGDAISFGCEEYAISLPDIERYIGHQIPRAAIDAVGSGRRDRAASRAMARTSAASGPVARRRQPCGGGARSGGAHRPGGRSSGGPRRAPANPRPAHAAAPTREHSDARGSDAPAGAVPARRRRRRNRGGGPAGGAPAAAHRRAAAHRCSHELGHPIDRRIAARILRRSARIRQPYRAQPRDAETARRIEDRRCCHRRITCVAGQTAPSRGAAAKTPRLLWEPETGGRVARVEMSREPHLLVLDRQSDRMRIGDEHAALAAPLELQQEILRSRQEADLFAERHA